MKGVKLAEGFGAVAMLDKAAKTLLGHINLLQGVVTRIETSMQLLPNGQRDELEMIHKRLANVVGVMKEDVFKIL